MSQKEIDIEFLKHLALLVYDSVTPIIGAIEAAKKLKKGAGGDISMQIDIIAENTIISELNRSNLNIMLLSEEVGEMIIGDGEVVERTNEKLIIDPIDGSNNSIRDIPFFCVSIAYAKGVKINDIEKAVILDLNTKDIYWAEKGKGAFLNDDKLTIPKNNLSNKLIFEVDFDLSKASEQFMKYDSVLKHLYKIRVLGSVALSFCLFSKGSFDGYINLNEHMRLVDIAAAYLIVKESGGKIFSISGKKLNLSLSMEPFLPIIVCRSDTETFFKEILRKINP